MAQGRPAQLRVTITPPPTLVRVKPVTSWDWTTYKKTRDEVIKLLKASAVAARNEPRYPLIDFYANLKKTAGVANNVPVVADNNFAPYTTKIAALSAIRDEDFPFSLIDYIRRKKFSPATNEWDFCKKTDPNHDNPTAADKDTEKYYVKSLCEFFGMGYESFKVLPPSMGGADVDLWKKTVAGVDATYNVVAICEGRTDPNVALKTELYDAASLLLDEIAKGKGDTVSHPLPYGGFLTTKATARPPFEVAGQKLPWNKIFNEMVRIYNTNLYVHEIAGGGQDYKIPEDTSVLLEAAEQYLVYFIVADYFKTRREAKKIRDSDIRSSYGDTITYVNEFLDEYVSDSTLRKHVTFIEDHVYKATKDLTYVPDNENEIKKAQREISAKAENFETALDEYSPIFSTLLDRLYQDFQINYSRFSPDVLKGRAEVGIERLQQENVIPQNANANELRDKVTRKAHYFIRGILEPVDYDAVSLIILLLLLKKYAMYLNSLVTSCDWLLGRAAPGGAPAPGAP